MMIAILADDPTKQRLLLRLSPDLDIVWPDSLRALLITVADVYIDLLFEDDDMRTSRLKKLLPSPVIVNDGAGDEDVLNVIGLITGSSKDDFLKKHQQRPGIITATKLLSNAAAELHGKKEKRNGADTQH